MVLPIRVFKNYKAVMPVITCHLFETEFIVTVLPRNLLFTLRLYKNHTHYLLSLLTCVSGVDIIHSKYRFCIAYEFISIKRNTRLRVKTFFTEIVNPPSIISIFVCANWWEREIWDLFGIYFIKHTDLRRILTDYGFEGHPLRKDFPLCGYMETGFNEYKKAVDTQFAQFTQEPRGFFFENPWVVSL